MLFLRYLKKGIWIRVLQCGTLRTVPGVPHFDSIKSSFRQGGNDFQLAHAVAGIEVTQAQNVWSVCGNFFGHGVVKEVSWGDFTCKVGAEDLTEGFCSGFV